MPPCGALFKPPTHTHSSAEIKLCLSLLLHYAVILHRSLISAHCSWVREPFQDRCSRGSISLSRTTFRPQKVATPRVTGEECVKEEQGEQVRNRRGHTGEKSRL